MGPIRGARDQPLCSPARPSTETAACVPSRHAAVLKFDRPGSACAEIAVLLLNEVALLVQRRRFPRESDALTARSRPVTFHLGGRRCRLAAEACPLSRPLQGLGVTLLGEAGVEGRWVSGHLRSSSTSPEGRSESGSGGPCAPRCHWPHLHLRFAGPSSQPWGLSHGLGPEEGCTGILEGCPQGFGLGPKQRKPFSSTVRRFNQ